MAKIINCYSELKENSAYELMYEGYLDEIKSSGIILKHKKSGARICVMSNDDENKMFCAAFRTPPKDSTGVAHIIEHTVLCGSKNYPSRDPFMQLVKGSLNTFLNAMTYPDKTMYPVASCNDKDFINLMNVYMDAVFYPNIYKYRQIFMQEGWHYEMQNPEDDLTINGVVYSEMKGALSSPDRTIWEQIAFSLYPDTTYGVNSGGDPEVIPSLTYENYLDFHRKYYHPSNSYIFIYGDCDMDERLEWMDKNYFSSFNEIEVDSGVTLQKRFDSCEPKRVDAHYSVGSEDETEGKAFLAYAALGGSNLDVLECRAWGILSSVLLNSDGAPLKKALIDAGIGDDIWGGYDSHMLEDSFAVIAKNANADDADRFYQIIIDTLKNEVEKGINEKAILATLNRREFNFREADYGGFPKGLDFASNILQSWLYDENGAFTYMHTLADYAELKKRIGTGYYEGLVRKYILEADHSILLRLLPEKGLVDRKEEALKEKLAAYKASLSKEEVDKIVEETRLLREYQSHDPTEEELSCIPSLKRTDIPRETVGISNIECEIGGHRAVSHDIESNGITYLDIYFDIGKIPQKYVPYVGLLEYVLGRIDTAEHTYDELAIDLKL
ncbi:MAG: insulinase family protein, partial [Ruminococcaceae bacterium]|nr:insulinase family protein [Oscillospiraceae bacterium]